MTNHPSDSLVTVYSTPVSFDAGLVKAMLAEQDIPCSVEDANGPFPGLAAVPCHILVAAEYESLARKLIEEHEAEHLKRVERESL